MSRQTDLLLSMLLSYDESLHDCISDDANESLKAMLERAPSSEVNSIIDSANDVLTDEALEFVENASVPQLLLFVAQIVTPGKAIPGSQLRRYARRVVRLTGMYPFDSISWSVRNMLFYIRDDVKIEIVHTDEDCTIPAGTN